MGDAPRSHMLHSKGAIAARGGGLYPFFLHPAKEGCIGMRKTVLLLASVAIAVLLASGVALALPSETPDNTPMIDGRVRAIEQVGTNIWVGGRFTQVKKRNGTVLDNVTNLAVFDSQTEQYKPIAPDLGGTGAEVWDMMVYGTGPAAEGRIAGTPAGAP